MDHPPFSVSSSGVLRLTDLRVPSLPSLVGYLLGYLFFLSAVALGGRTLLGPSDLWFLVVVAAVAFVLTDSINPYSFFVGLIVSVPGWPSPFYLFLVSLALLSLVLLVSCRGTNQVRRRRILWFLLPVPFLTRVPCVARFVETGRSVPFRRFVSVSPLPVADELS
jgi:hypothetical protein